MNYLIGKIIFYNYKKHNEIIAKDWIVVEQSKVSFFFKCLAKARAHRTHYWSGNYQTRALLQSLLERQMFTDMYGHRCLFGFSTLHLCGITLYRVSRQYRTMALLTWFCWVSHLGLNGGSRGQLRMFNAPRRSLIVRKGILWRSMDT